MFYNYQRFFDIRPGPGYISSSACLPVMPFLIPRPIAPRFTSFMIPVRISLVFAMDGPVAGRTFAAG